MITSHSQRLSMQKSQTRMRYANVALRLRQSSTRFAVAKKNSMQLLPSKARCSLKLKRISTHSMRCGKNSAELNHLPKSVHDSWQKRRRKREVQDAIQKPLIKKRHRYVQKSHNFAPMFRTHKVHLQTQHMRWQQRRQRLRQRKTQLLLRCGL